MAAVTARGWAAMGMALAMMALILSGAVIVVARVILAVIMAIITAVNLDMVMAVMVPGPLIPCHLPVFTAIARHDPGTRLAFPHALLQR